MPKDKNNNQAMTKDEKFRSFFSTTAVNIPEEMTRRDEELPEEKPQKRFGLFARGKADQEEAQAAESQEMPTGEVVLGGDAQPEQEADLELMLKPAADPERELAPWPLLETEAEDAEPLRVDLPAPAPAKEPEPPRQSTAPVAEPAGQRSEAKISRNPKNAPEVLLPQEEQEQQEMAQLKAMINGLSEKKPAPGAAAPTRTAQAEETAPAAQPETAPERKKEESGTPLPAAVFASVKEADADLQPKEKTRLERKKPLIDFFGHAEDEEKPQAPSAPADAPAAKEDTMSLPLLPLDGEAPAAEPQAKAEAAPQPEQKPEAGEPAPLAEEPESELQGPEATAEKLHRMSAELTLRCVLGGILAVVLLHFGLVSDGLLPAMAALDPDAAPAAFYGANLLLLAASLCVGFPVLRDGLTGLRGRSSADTMPALAAAAALLQAVTAMLNANVYRGTTGISLLSGMAALGLFLALLGSRVQLAGFDIAKPAVRLAAKALPTAQYAVASSFSQPVRTGWADLLLNCFSPFAQEEFLRVLRPGGRMIYVVPGAEHLYQMKAVLYEKPYKNPVQQIDYAGFRAIGEREVSGRITVPQDQLEALFAMTPYYWKTPRGGAERLAALPELETEISFRFLLLEKE